MVIVLWVDNGPLFQPPINGYPSPIDSWSPTPIETVTCNWHCANQFSAHPQWVLAINFLLIGLASSQHPQCHAARDKWWPESYNSQDCSSLTPVNHHWATSVYLKPHEPCFNPYEVLSQSHHFWFDSNFFIVDDSLPCLLINSPCRLIIMFAIILLVAVTIKFWCDATGWLRWRLG